MGYGELCNMVMGYGDLRIWYYFRGYGIEKVTITPLISAYGNLPYHYSPYPRSLWSPYPTTRAIATLTQMHATTNFLYFYKDSFITN